MNCRSCGVDDLRIVLDLGLHPIANALLNEEDLSVSELCFPLKLVFCPACSMLQVTETVPSDILYQRDYPYFSSYSTPVLQHSVEHVETLIRKYDLGHHSFVVEVASNDGYLLQNFVKRGIPCLGVDPAKGPVAIAQSIGVPTIYGFFGLNCSKRLVDSGHLADVVIANNVLAHVADINDFVAGISHILKPNGVAVFELAYAVDMVEQCTFDTIYHEHVFYHTLLGLSPLFMRHDLYLNDARRLSIHGGSLRVTVSHKPGVTTTLAKMIENEVKLGVDGLSYYRNFGDRVAELQRSLVNLLVTKKSEDNRIACYGATAKGSTLLNSLNLGEKFFEFVVDSTPAKQGKYMPGQHIPICSPNHLLTERPDDVLLLAWNFADYIIRKEADYRKLGGRFIIPIPQLCVVSDERKAA